MNRHERRRAGKGKPAGVRSEFYQMIGKGGVPLLLDVRAMRRWAQRHAELVKVPVDLGYIERLFARGAITNEGLEKIVATGRPKPILLCRDINDEGDEIVDGNHTYAATAVAWSIARRQGSAPAEAIPWAEAYLLEREQWLGFVVSRPAASDPLPESRMKSNETP